MAPDPPAAVTTPRRSKLRRRLVLMGALLAAAWLGRYAYSRLTGEPDLREAYWAARIDELDPVPANEELERIAHAQIDSLVATPAPLNAIMSDRSSINRADVRDALKQRFESQNFTNSYASLIRCLAAGWRVPQEVRRQLSYWAGSMHWGYVQLAQWLGIHADWRRREGLDPAGSMEDWLLLVRLARQARRATPVGTTASYVLGCLACDVQMAVESGRFAAGQARQLMQAVDDILGPGLDPLPFARCAQVFMQCDLDARYVRDEGWFSIAATAYSRASLSSFAPPAASRTSRIWNLLSFVYDDYSTAQQKVQAYVVLLESQTNLVECARRTVSANSAALTVPGPLQGLNRSSSLHGLTNTVLHYQARMYLDAAIARLALAEFERDRGNSPATLDELVPLYLPRLPVDYADGRPLRYRNDGRYVLLYSIGSDGIDDGDQKRSPVVQLKPGSIGYALQHDIVFMRHAVKKAAARPAAAAKPAAAAATQSAAP